MRVGTPSFVARVRMLVVGLLVPIIAADVSPEVLYKRWWSLEVLYNTISHRISRALDKTYHGHCPMDSNNEYEHCVTTINGRVQQIYVDPQDETVPQPFRRGKAWESWMHAYFQKYSDLSAIAVDVGANIGGHTLALAPLFATVHSFEMQDRAMRVLRKNVAANTSPKRVRLHHVPLGRTNGASGHYCDSNSKGVANRNIGGVGASRDARLPSWRQGCHRIQFSTLDKILGNVGNSAGNTSRRIALIKVDVEGFEEEVLLGAQRIIARHRPVIMFESFTLGRNLTNMLSKFGYNIRLVQHLVDYIATPPLSWG